MDAKTDAKGNLVLTLPMQSPAPSKSGKTMIVATTGGFVPTAAEVNGAQVSVSVNATIKA